MFEFDWLDDTQDAKATEDTDAQSLPPVQPLVPETPIPTPPEPPAVSSSTVSPSSTSHPVIYPVPKLVSKYRRRAPQSIFRPQQFKSLYARLIFFYRILHNVTQQQLAYELCMSFPSINRWERCRVMPASAIIPTLVQSNILRLKPEYAARMKSARDFKSLMRNFDESMLCWFDEWKAGLPMTAWLDKLAQEGKLRDGVERKRLLLAQKELELEELGFGTGNGGGRREEGRREEGRREKGIGEQGIGEQGIGEQGIGEQDRVAEISGEETTEPVLPSETPAPPHDSTVFPIPSSQQETRYVLHYNIRKVDVEPQSE